VEEKIFRGIKKCSFVLFVFFVKSQRLYQAQSVPQVFRLMPPFSIIQKIFTIFSALFLFAWFNGFFFVLLLVEHLGL